jgi:predicted nucleic acid-binding protein
VKPGLFLDTSAWFAALSDRDQNHARAARYYRDVLTAGKFALVTTNLVIAELHAMVSRRQGPAPGLRLLEGLRADPLHEVVWVNRDLHWRAVDRWLRPFADQPFSLVDAVGFEVMRERGLRTAFSTNQDFQVAGFEVVPS